MKKTKGIYRLHIKKVLKSEGTLTLLQNIFYEVALLLFSPYQNQRIIQYYVYKENLFNHLISKLCWLQGDLVEVWV